MNDTHGMTRRDFLKASAVASAALATAAPHVFAGGSDMLRVGVIGCGGRGTSAAVNCLESSEGVEIVALCDLFEDRVLRSWKRLRNHTKVGGGVKVEKRRVFWGFDAYEKVLESGVDMVIMATPPHFRPCHFKAAVEAGKHVFMEKPVAVDPPGVRSVMESADLAGKKSLGVVSGTQRRHQAHYMEIMKRIHGGALGEITGASCYWNSGALWEKRAADNFMKWRMGKYSDMEYQCRNWLFFTWLSGDHLVEQHMHNLDVINWALGAHPERALGMGGRQARTEPQYGNIWDHFAVEYVYPSGRRVHSMCRQTPGASVRIAEQIVGTLGRADTSRSHARISGKNAWEHEEESTNPYIQEHTDLIRSIREGKPLNEGRQVAESTMTAILGRMSAYTGREVSWKWAMKSSKLDTILETYEFGDLMVDPVAVPGKTKLV